MSELKVATCHMRRETLAVLKQRHADLALDFNRLREASKHAPNKSIVKLTKAYRRILDANMLINELTVDDVRDDRFAIEQEDGV